MNPKNKHNWIEKTIHNMAFAPWYPQLAFSDIESSLYHADLQKISTDKPIFITSLPRAGTTLLLELCMSTNQFASHAYKDMPFIFSPILWNTLSKKFRKPGNLSERVHGDGIYINVDSSESFEEIIWKKFWPSRYKQNRIVPWTGTKYPRFENFFREHMRKIIFLSDKRKSQLRYISKNNLNIARTNYLSNAFPNATIIIPFRSPLQQSTSLLKQHLNFLKIHKEDNFAKKYMENTGHYDFGMNLRPVDFNQWLSAESVPNSDDLSFWLIYWINTFRYLLDHANPNVQFFSYDLLCKDPDKGLKLLSEIIKIDDKNLLLKNSDLIKKPSNYTIDQEKIDQETIKQSNKIFNSLCERANVESIL
ncbi:sulfotransferase [bacterium]|nr:sulfotransferase [bacterium]